METHQKNPVLLKITYFFDIIYRLLLEYSKFVLLLIIFIVSAQVFCRKFLGTSIRWSEEVALLLMVWMAFISMAIGVEKGLHIAIGMFYNRFPAPMQKVIAKMNTIIICIFGVILMYYGGNLVMSTMTSTLPATQWPAGLLYMMIPVSGLFITYFTLIELFNLQEYLHKDIEDGGDK